MYTHNLTILLANEPLTLQLFLMSSHPSQSHTAQNTIVSYRSSKTDFEAFLAEYFSFVLLDGQSYIKFLKHTETDKAPYSFMLLRIMGQAPLLYLKFAFQANATTVDRHKVMNNEIDESHHCVFVPFRLSEISVRNWFDFVLVHEWNPAMLTRRIVNNKPLRRFHRRVVNAPCHRRSHRVSNVPYRPVVLCWTKTSNV